MLPVTGVVAAHCSPPISRVKDRADLTVRLDYQVGLYYPAFDQTCGRHRIGMHMRGRLKRCQRIGTLGACSNSAIMGTKLLVALCTLRLEKVLRFRYLFFIAASQASETLSCDEKILKRDPISE